MPGMTIWPKPETLVRRRTVKAIVNPRAIIDLWTKVTAIALQNQPPKSTPATGADANQSGEDQAERADFGFCDGLVEEKL